MEATLFFGILVLVGFLVGELAEIIHLPKISGYIIAGILLKVLFDQAGYTLPPSEIDVVTDIALSFIAFSVGGNLLFSRLRQQGISISIMTICEAEGAYLLVFLGLLLACPLLEHLHCPAWQGFLLPFALLTGALASPTDPSATLALKHEYHAEGEVTRSVMGIAALDDVLTILNFSFAVMLAGFLLGSSAPASPPGHPLLSLFLALMGGAFAGLFFNGVTSLLARETEGALIVIILGTVCTSFGLAAWLGCDPILTTMIMGAVVVNANKQQERVFQVLDRYVDELVFVLFFTLSGMLLNFMAFSQSLVLILVFVTARAAGKIAGTRLGARIVDAPPAVSRYTALALLPQGGIVIGLALTLRDNPAFTPVSDMLMSIIIGATVIHELIGPLIARSALRRSGELHPAERPQP